MIPYLRHGARIGSALLLFGCSAETGPTLPATDTSALLLPGTVGSSSTALTEEELAAMPAEFATPPSLISGRTVVGFNEDGAYAEGITEYFATNAGHDITLTVSIDGRETGRRTTSASNDDFFPDFRTLRSFAVYPMSASCGHLADGQTAHRVFHKFIVDGWKFLSWGEVKKPSGDYETQPACPAPPPPEDDSGGGGGGDAPYEGECQSCQQWFWYEDGQIVDEWWECTPTDSWRCDNLAT